MKSTPTLYTARLLPSPKTSDVSQDDVFPALDLRRILTLSFISGVVWLTVISTGIAGRWIGAAFAGVLLLGSILLISKRETVGSLAIVVYLAAIQPALRTYASSLPYLTLGYFFLLWVLLALSKRKIHLQAPAVFYLLYLILETLGITVANDMEQARFILINSMTVGAALLLAGDLRFGKTELRQLFTAFLIGVSNLIVIIGYGYATNSSIRWSTASNFSASGDMGPVHISMLLAVGVTLFLLLANRVSVKYQLTYLVLAVGISLVMLLTFSRSGLYLSILALIVYYVLFSRFSFRSIFTIFFLVILGFFLFQVVIQIAGPAFVARYSDPIDSARLRLFRYGWDIFLSNPILGVGTSNYYAVVGRAEYFGIISGAHNELIRVAAEHGIFGLITWVLFALSSVWLAFGLRKGKTRALSMTLLSIFFAYLAVNGLKLLTQPLILLIALSSDDF